MTGIDKKNQFIFMKNVFYFFPRPISPRDKTIEIISAWIILVIHKQQFDFRSIPMFHWKKTAMMLQAPADDEWKKNINTGQRLNVVRVRKIRDKLMDERERERKKDTCNSM